MWLVNKGWATWTHQGARDRGCHCEYPGSPAPVPGPRLEAQEQVDKTEGEQGLSPLPQALSGQPSPGWKRQNIPHPCARVCAPGHSPTGAYTHPCMHTHHTRTQPHTGKHMLHTHTRVHRCSHVAVCVHVCTHRCTDMHVHVCAWVHVCTCVHITHVCRHTNACVHMRGPTGPHKYVHVGVGVYTCAHIGAGVHVCTHRYMHAHA